MVVLGRWVLLGTSGREAAMEHRDQLERLGHRYEEDDSAESP